MNLESKANRQVKLFTPGPLNTSVNVKMAMNQDIGSRTQTLVELTSMVRVGIENISECGCDYTSVLFQGSGTFALEAMITSFVPENGFVLVLSNGVYGDRLARICDIHHIKHKVLRSSDLVSINMDDVRVVLESESNITHIALVQFETSIGVLNDADKLTALASQYDCEVLIDAMSAFGAFSLNYSAAALTAVASSSNKCLHSVPGVSFVIARTEKIHNISFKRTLCLDLKDQWQEFESSGQWRFTPPIHALLALEAAITEYKKMGGTQARLEKYKSLSELLISEMEKIDIYPIVQKEYRAPVITTFSLGDKYDFDATYLYQKLFMQGMVIYPSQFADKKSFRVGCIGDIKTENIYELVQAIKNISTF